MVCFHMSDLLPVSPDPGISKTYFISTDYWSLQAVVKNGENNYTWSSVYNINIYVSNAQKKVWQGSYKTNNGD